MKLSIVFLFIILVKLLATSDTLEFWVVGSLGAGHLIQLILEACQLLLLVYFILVEFLDFCSLPVNFGAELLELALKVRDHLLVLAVLIPS